MPEPTSLVSSSAQIEARALAAERQGRFDEALAGWRELLAVEPNHIRALTATGYDAQRRGELAQAREALTRAAKLTKDDPTPWINVARICRQQGDEPEEERALFQALTIDPGDLLALLMRGELFERQGRTHEAAKAFGTATMVAPPPDRLRPELRPLVSHAAAVRDRYSQSLAEHLEAALEHAYQAHGGGDLARFKLSLDIMLGRKKRFESQPSQFLVPNLPSVEFYERSAFPWLDEIEAGTDAIRDEFLGLPRDDEGFAPYLNYGADKPLNQFSELNKSLRWSAYHLIKDGQVNADAAAKCPRTMQLLAAAPQPDQPGRTPVALFSLLRPRTRIPPHNGVSNARVLVHLPLIVPAGCGFRVGNQTRSWVPGHALIFDDTIEHEAWNDSDELRVIMIFDIWHPALSVGERAMIKATSEALNAFAGMPEGYGA
jgi:aspartate beta-hydroxylase